MRLAALHRPLRYTVKYEGQQCVWSRVDLPVLDIPRHHDDDFPMTLENACKVEFGGAIKPASLRAEHRRGNLVLEKVGRTHLVTRNAIRDMRRKCQLDPQVRDPGFGSSQSAGTATEVSKPHGGSFVTAASSAALDSLKANVARLKEH